mgnify:CR=1 FL=1
MISMPKRMNRHDVSGVFAELIHGAAGCGQGSGFDRARMPTTRPWDRQPSGPLTAEAAAARHADETNRGNFMARTRRPLIAGNWKMNGLRADALALAKGRGGRREAGRLDATARCWSVRRRRWSWPSPRR